MSLVNVFRLIVLSILWSVSFLFLKLGASVFGAGILIEIRVFSAAVLLTLIAWWMKRKLNFAEHKVHYFIIGFFNLALPFTLFAYAAQSLDVSLMAVLNSSAPILGALFSLIWLKTKLTPSIFLGLLLGVVGVVILSWDGLMIQNEIDWLPLLASLAGAACYAIASVYTKKTSKTISPFDNARGTLWAASLLMIPVALLIPIQHPPVAMDWVWALALGLLSTGLAFMIYFKIIEEEGPIKALSVTFIIPVFGVLWGYGFLDETIGWNLLIGGGLILLAVALTNELIRFRFFKKSALNKPLDL